MRVPPFFLFSSVPSWERLILSEAVPIMSCDLIKTRDALERGAFGTVMVAAGAITVGLDASLDLFSGEVANDPYAEFLKMTVAVAVGCAVHRFGSALMHGVARMEAHERRRIRPAIALGFVAVLGTSTYPLAAKYGQEIFSDAHFSISLEQASRDKDAFGSGLREFERLAATAKDCTAEFTLLAEQEKRGAYSGFPATTGPLISYFDALASKCRTFGETITAASSVTSALLSKTDAGLLAMQQAAADKLTALKDRIAAFRKGSEQFRSGIVEAAAKLPLGPAIGFGTSFLGAQAEPALSSKEKVALGQANGLEQARRVQRKYGQDVVDQTSAISKKLATSPSPFSMPSPAQLPLMYWLHGIPIFAIAISLDGLVLLMFVFLAHLNDAIRERERKRPDMLEGTAEIVDAVFKLKRFYDEQPQALGPIAFPSATKLRTTSPKTNGSARSGAASADGGVS